MFFGPRSNIGDKVVARLALGQTKQQVSDNMRDINVTKSDERFELSPLSYSFFGAHTEATPFDLLRFLAEGTETWSLGYFVSSNDLNAVRVFFSDDGHVIGWTWFLSDRSRQRYMHEKITRQLKRGMTDAQVVKLLGEPQAIIARPTWKEQARNIYIDHFWETDPVKAVRPDMWVYSYQLMDGSERHVYILWNRELIGWGYDRAHLETDQ